MSDIDTSSGLVGFEDVFDDDLGFVLEKPCQEVDRKSSILPENIYHHLYDILHPIIILTPGEDIK